MEYRSTSKWINKVKDKQFSVLFRVNYCTRCFPIEKHTKKNRANFPQICTTWTALCCSLFPPQIQVTAGIEKGSYAKQPAGEGDITSKSGKARPKTPLTQVIILRTDEGCRGKKVLSRVGTTPPQHARSLCRILHPCFSEIFSPFSAFKRTKKLSLVGKDFRLDQDEWYKCESGAVCKTNQR